MTDLPKGWATAKVGDFLYGIKAGKNLKCEERQPEAHERGVIKVSAVTWGTFDASQSKTLPVSFTPAPGTDIKAGDFLFSRANTVELVGAVVVVKNDHPNLFLSDKVLRLELPDELKPWLLTYLGSFEGKQKLGAVSSGNQASMRNIGQDSLRSVTIPLPPLPEQHRIVAKIEALFSELDAGQDSLTRAQAQLKLYRQSLLKAAFQGRLTADWRAANPDKLESPETLLSRIRSEREARYKQALDDWQQALAEWRAGGEVGRKPAKPSRPAAIPNEDEIIRLQQNGWAIVPMGLVIDDPAYGTSKKCDYPPTGLGVLRIPNIASGVIDATDLKYAEFDEAEREAYRLEVGDLLTIRSNGSVSLVGKTALIGEAETDFLYAGYLIRLRANQKVIDPRFLLRALESHDLRSQIEGKAKSTSGVNNINSGELRELAIPVCAIGEQQQIVVRLDERLSSVEAIETEITTALARITALRQSILKQAFSGHLVPQDPADEPASALLARLRASAPPARAKRKTTA